MIKREHLYERPIEWQEFNKGFKTGFIWGVIAILGLAWIVISIIWLIKAL